MAWIPRHPAKAFKDLPTSLGGWWPALWFAGEILVPGSVLATRGSTVLLRFAGAPESRLWVVPRVERPAENGWRVQWERVTNVEFLAWYSKWKIIVFVLRFAFGYLVLTKWPDAFEVAAGFYVTPWCDRAGVGNWWRRRLTDRRVKAARAPEIAAIGEDKVIVTPVLRAVEKFCVGRTTFDGFFYALQAFPAEGKTTAAVVVAGREMKTRSPCCATFRDPGFRQFVVDMLHYHFNPFYAPTTTIVVRVETTVFNALLTYFPLKGDPDSAVAQLIEAIGKDYVPHVLHWDSLAWLRPTPPRVTFIFDQADDNDANGRAAEFLRLSDLCRQLPDQVRALALVKHPRTLDELQNRNGGTLRQFMRVDRWDPASLKQLAAQKGVQPFDHVTMKSPRDVTVKRMPMAIVSVYGVEFEVPISDTDVRKKPHSDGPTAQRIALMASERLGTQVLSTELAFTAPTETDPNVKVTLKSTKLVFGDRTDTLTTIFRDDVNTTSPAFRESMNAALAEASAKLQHPLTHSDVTVVPDEAADSTQLVVKRTIVKDGPRQLELPIGFPSDVNSADFTKSKRRLVERMKSDLEIDLWPSDVAVTVSGTGDAAAVVKQTTVKCGNRTIDLPIGAPPPNSSRREVDAYEERLATHASRKCKMDLLPNDLAVTVSATGDAAAVVKQTTVKHGDRTIALLISAPPPNSSAEEVDAFQRQLALRASRLFDVDLLPSDLAVTVSATGDAAAVVKQTTIKCGNRTIDLPIGAPPPNSSRREVDAFEERLATHASRELKIDLLPSDLAVTVSTTGDATAVVKQTFVSLGTRPPLQLSIGFPPRRVDAAGFQKSKRRLVEQLKDFEIDARFAVDVTVDEATGHATAFVRRRWPWE